MCFAALGGLTQGVHDCGQAGGACIRILEPLLPSLLLCGLSATFHLLNGGLKHPVGQIDIG